MADPLNAALGAAFGEIVPAVKMLVTGLMSARQCMEEFKALGVVLQDILPSLESICKSRRHDPAQKEWLNAFKKCVQDAEVVLQKCEGEQRFMNAFYKLFYRGDIKKLHDRINELTNQVSLIRWASEKSSYGIMQEVPKTIFGMDAYFERVKSTICEAQNKEEASCVVIRGTGGAGKTLLAKMVNNDEVIQKAFVTGIVIWITVGRDANISEIYNRMRKCLEVHDNGGSLDDQRTDLMNAFAHVKTLLILDDVWKDFHEMKNMDYWLNIAQGSKCVTVITTRNELFTQKCINIREEIILRLSEEESWQLFCTHAFDTVTPTLNAEMEVKARAICGECACLPLALKVIGCAMKDQSDWTRLWSRLKASVVPNQSIEEELFERLGLSYEALDGRTKICFLYFAAFPEDYKVSVKELCQLWVVEGLFGEIYGDKEAWEEANYALKELVRRSLIEVSEVDCDGALQQVMMHDILRDLANKLVSEGNDQDRECLFKIEKNNVVEFPSSWLGREMKVKRLFMWCGSIKRFPDEVLAPELKICALLGDFYAGVNGSTSSTPIGLDYKIRESFFRKLRALRFLQISEFVQLEQLPESMGELGSLQHLDLSGCKALKQLPESMGELGSLQHLDLSGCKALKQLPESMGDLGSLQHLDLSMCTALKQLPESMGDLGSLQHLDLSWCDALKQLPESMGKLGSLQHLDLLWCDALKQLPESMGELGSLQYLDLSRCLALVQLPESMGELGSLQHLDLSRCTALKQLPESMGELGSLQHLDLPGCKALKQLPESMGELGSLQHLDLSGCKALKQLPESMGELGSLQHLDLSACIALKQLPESMGDLGSLQHLDLSRCTALKQLPESMGDLGSLQHLDLSWCLALEQLPESMGELGSLQRLSLSGCKALKQLPETMGKLGFLEDLDLSGCDQLKGLPESMGGLRFLKLLKLSRCNSSISLPDFSKLKQLQMLF